MKFKKTMALTLANAMIFNVLSVSAMTPEQVITMTEVDGYNISDDTSVIADYSDQVQTIATYPSSYVGLSATSTKTYSSEITIYDGVSPYFFMNTYKSSEYCQLINSITLENASNVKTEFIDFLPDVTSGATESVTIDKGLSVGVNTLTIGADGYDPAVLTINVKVTVPTTGFGISAKADGSEYNNALIELLVEEDGYLSFDSSVSGVDAYQDAISKIVLRNSDGISKEISYNGESVLKISYEDMTPGTNSITITADGYDDHGISIVYDEINSQGEEPPYSYIGICTGSSKTEYANSTTLTYGTASYLNMGTSAGTYINAIQSTTLTDANGNQSACDLVISTYTSKGTTYTSAALAIASSSLPVGTNVIVVRANGYQNAVFTIEVTPIANPFSINSTLNTYETKDTIYFTSSSSNVDASMFDVTVNGVDVSDKFTGSSSTYYLDGSLFVTPGEYEVVFSSNNYYEKTINFTILKDLPENIGLKSSLSDATFAKELVVPQYENAFFVIDDTNEEVKSYLENVTGNIEVSYASGVTQSIDISNTEIEFPWYYFDVGVNTITILADGYAIGSFDVIYGKDEVPTYVGLGTSSSATTYSSFLAVEQGNSAYLNISNTNASAVLYKSRITSVEIEYANGETESMDYSSNSVMFTSNKLQVGENFITVKATGYEDVSYTVVVNEYVPENVGLSVEGSYALDAKIAVDEAITVLIDDEDYKAQIQKITVTYDGGTSEIIETPETNELVFEAGSLEAGFNTVKIEAYGYSYLSLSVLYSEKATPSKSYIGIASSSSASTFYDTLSVTPTSTVYLRYYTNNSATVSYAAAIESIDVINAEGDSTAILANENVSTISSGSSSSSKNTSTHTTITSSSFSLGTNYIVVKALGYETKTFELNVAYSTNPFTQLSTNSTYSNSYLPETRVYFYTSTKISSSSTLAGFTVTVLNETTGEEVTSALTYASNYYHYIDGSYFTEYGNYTVTLAYPNYSDAVFNFNIGNTAPTDICIDTIASVTATITGTDTLVLEENENAYVIIPNAMEFYNEIEEITVTNPDGTKNSVYTDSNADYYFTNEDTRIVSVEIPVETLKVGKNVIIIQNIKYQPVNSFTIYYGTANFPTGNVGMITDLGFEENTTITYGESAYIGFNSDDASSIAYRDAITSIVVTSDDKETTISNPSQTTTSVAISGLSMGNHVVTIEATGYATKTFEIEVIAIEIPFELETTEIFLGDTIDFAFSGSTSDVNNFNILINGRSGYKLTSNNGLYSIAGTYFYTAGEYEITFTRDNYFNKTFTVTIVDGNAPEIAVYDFNSGDEVLIFVDDIASLEEIFATSSTSFKGIDLLDRVVISYANENGVLADFDAVKAYLSMSTENKVTVTYSVEDDDKKATEFTLVLAVTDVAVYRVSVVNGTADVAFAQAGQEITITALSDVEDANFVNWISDSNITFADKFSEETTFVMPNEIVVITAVFEEILNEDKDETPEVEQIGIYTISFDTNGGIAVRDLDTDENGQLQVIPYTTKDNFTFEGWYFGEYVVSYDTVFIENTTVVASWKSNSTGTTTTTTTTTTGSSFTSTDTEEENTNNDENLNTEEKTEIADVSTSDWYYEAVQYVLENGLFTGVNESEFAPEKQMSRAMLWTVLYRNAGETGETTGANWYAESQKWSIEQGISDGSNPDGDMTREELATMLYRSAGEPQVETNDISAYTDGSSVSSWSKDAMNWAVEKGIITGKLDNNLAPTETATRAEVATMLMRFLSK